LRERFHKTPATLGPEILRVQDLTRQGVLSDISFSLYAGEILGFTGLTGSGGTMLAQVLFGASPIDSGTIVIEQQPANIRSPQDAIAHGIGLLTERRHEQGLILDMSAHNNMTLAALGLVHHGLLLDHDAEHALVLQYATRLGLRRERLDQKALYLSSGTQQKLVLAKWLATHSRVLIFDEPTQGVDVGARVEIYRLIDELAHQGVGIIVISSNMSEILGICDRIMVLRLGCIVAELPREHATQSLLLDHAGGRGGMYG
jgi:ribose transport system ATP-binding protein